MTPLAKRKVDRLIELRRYQAAREYLRSMPNDHEAQHLLADMAVTYPDTRLERGLRQVNSAVLWLLVGVACLVGAALLVGIVQLLQAQAVR